MRSFLPMICFISIGINTFASTLETLEPIIHTSKQEIKQNHMIEKTQVIPIEDIKLSASHRIENLIANLPGIYISHSGAIGGESSIFVRGTEARHTLILIDGVKFYDPTSVGRTLNLGTLNTSDIERIEFISGDQSVLYGSDAIGGVINVITKKGQNKNFIAGTTGYYRQIRSENTVNFERNVLSVAAHYLDSDELSIVAGDGEKDININRGISINHFFSNDSFNMSTSFRYLDNYATADGFDFASQTPTEDKRAFGKDNQILFHHKTTTNIAEQRKLIFDLSFFKYKRENKYFEVIDYNKASYIGDNMTVEIRLQDDFLDGNVIYGVAESKDLYRDDEIASLEQNSFALFANHYQRINKYIVNYGFRLTGNEYFGNHLVYKTSAKKIFWDNKLSLGASFGTGFKAPSIYQQFAPASSFGKIGNKDISPEKSESFETFFETSLNIYKARLSYFSIKVADLIDYGSAAQGFINISELRSRGVEVSQELKYGRSITSFDINLLKLEREDGNRVLRRPERMYVLRHKYSFNDRNMISSSWHWNDERYDVQGPKEIKLGAYDLLDVSYILKFQSLELACTVKNILDRKYELVKNYATLGRTVSVDLEFSY